MLIELLILLPIILDCITVHEYSHANAADILGDQTPRLAGRLTLNPLAHIDPVGFLALLIFRIGWAKPVPINPYNFRNPNQGMMLTGLAGPASNFFMAWILAIVLKTVPFSSQLWVSVLQTAIFINLALMIFNLLPIPPLDGSRIYTQFLPYEWQVMLERYGFFLLILIILLQPTQDLLFFLINSVYRLLML